MGLGSYEVRERLRLGFRLGCRFKVKILGCRFSDWDRVLGVGLGFGIRVIGEGVGLRFGIRVLGVGLGIRLGLG